jgi:hypothetical protein
MFSSDSSYNYSSFMLACNPSSLSRTSNTLRNHLLISKCCSVPRRDREWRLRQIIGRCRKRARRPSGIAQIHIIVGIYKDQLLTHIVQALSSQ